jgi:CRISPR-associated protein Cas2
MRCYLVCYDISDPKRWRAVYRIVREHGERWQYSLFFCRLRAVERVRLEAALRRVIDNAEDRILICDLGPDEESAIDSMVALGRQKIESERLRVI